MKRTKRTSTRKLFVILTLSILLLLVGAVIVSAQGGSVNLQVDGDVSVDSVYHVDKADMSGRKAQSGMISVIVDLDVVPVALYTGDVQGFAATSPDVTGMAQIDASSPAVRAYGAYVADQVNAFSAMAEATVPEATVVHKYTVVIGGVSMVLPASQVAAVAALPGVKAVYADRLEQLDTEVSPGFIGAPVAWEALGGQESAGEGVIVGVLDSGIWPEHPSVSDPDPSGKAYPAPPVEPGSNGFGSAGPKDTCDFGNTEFNPDDAPFTCNNKLIGAYDFEDTYNAVVGLLPEEFDSARDANGHGTHTLTTAAGNGGVEASIYDIPRGVVSGVAPRAHVIAFKVCGEDGCFNSDSAAAVQQAILDGVNVINFSISGGENPYSDAVSLAFLDAYAAGVLVSPSAGNSGPTPDSVAHREPWTLTVAASTADRFFVSTVTLTGVVSETAESETVELTGVTVTDGISEPTPVVSAADYGDKLCLNPFAADTFDGQIVVCERGTNARVSKSYNVAAGGAGGMLLYNPTLQGLSTDNYFLPGVHLENDQGAVLLDFMTKHTEVMGTFTMGVATEVQGDVMAAFSSRGGPGQTLGISKPDITAPGVQILAGMTPLPATEEGGMPGQLFQSIQGTSMSAPHITGSAALMKAMHPDWTPGQIKSALMTTALQSVVKENGTTPADAFDYGSGRVNLEVAGDPGLTISDSAVSYVMYENSLWDSNYPSLYVPQMPAYLSVSRILQSELDVFSRWNTTVIAPADLNIRVPNMIAMEPGSSGWLQIDIDASAVPLNQVRKAWLFLDSNTGHSAAFPIVIVRRPQTVLLDKTCEPTELEQGDDTTCTIDITNTSFNNAYFRLEDRLPGQLKLDPASVVDAEVDGNGIWLEGGLGAASVPVVSVIDGTDTTPAGYLPLSIFGIAPLTGTSDESITNLTVPGFIFAGDTYTRIGIVSNGYAVVGGGTGADVNYINQILPDPTPPNNVLAPFWTDLNPAFGGALRVGILSDSGMRWLILDWEGVFSYGDKLPNSFQIWIGLNGEEDISFTYGEVTDGDGGFLTVGAENKYGNSGANWYADGDGTLPVEDSEVRVVSLPGVPGETRTITYKAEGVAQGPWVNTAMLWADQNIGVSAAQVAGAVVPPVVPEPVTVELPLKYDTWTNGGVGAQNDNNNSFAALIVRPTGLDNILLTFDRSLLPAGATVSEASLMLNMDSQSGAFGKSLIGLNTGAFNPMTVTYNNAPATFNPSAAVAVPDAGGMVTLDVTDQIAAWNADATQLAVAAAGPPGRVVFDSLESFEAMPAKLMVTYTPAE